MPDRKQLQVGDKIRILCVPQADLDQREQELKDEVEMAGWTADAIERIIAEHPVVIIREVEIVNGTRLPWFEVKLKQSDGEPEWHSLTIKDDESWEFAE